jgi:hypothetical protein
MGVFSWDDPSWKTLLSITSSSLEEVKVLEFWGTPINESQEEWKTIDEFLCDLSRNVSGFRVILYPTGIDSKEDGDQLVGCVRAVWPKFSLMGGTVNLFPKL